MVASEPPAPDGPARAGEANAATRGSVIKLGAESTGRVVGLLTTLLIARGLGVDDFGVFAALSGIAVIAAEAADLGLQGTASRALVARTFSLGAMVRAKLLLTAAVSAVALGFPITGLGRLVRSASTHAHLLTPLVLYFTLAGWSEFLGVALRARGRRGQEAGIILCQRLTGLLFVALVFASHGGLPALSWALSLSPSLAIVIGSLAARGAYARDQTLPGDDPGSRFVLKTALPLAVNGGLALMSLRVELLALAFLRGAWEAGLFAAALKVIEFLNLVPSAVSAGAMPFLTREGLRRAGFVRQRTAGTIALLAAPAAVGLGLVAPALVSLLYGPDFGPAAGPLRVLALSVLPLFMNTVLLYSLIAVGRSTVLPVLTALRVASAVLLAWLLIPALGATGAALGFFCSELLLLVLASRACASSGFNVPVVKPVGLAFCASLPMAAAVALLGAGLIPSAMLGIVVYAATLALAWRLAPGLLEHVAIHFGAEGDDVARGSG